MYYLVETQRVAARPIQDFDEIGLLRLQDLLAAKYVHTIVRVGDIGKNKNPATKAGVLFGFFSVNFLVLKVYRSRSFQRYRLNTGHWIECFS